MPPAWLARAVWRVLHVLDPLVNPVCLLTDKLPAHCGSNFSPPPRRVNSLVVTQVNNKSPLCRELDDGISLKLTVLCERSTSVHLLRWISRFYNGYEYAISNYFSLSYTH